MAIPFQICWLQHALLGCIHFLYVTFSLRESYDSHISYMLGSPEQSRVHFHSLMQWPPCRSSHAAHLTSVAFLNSGGRFSGPFTHVSFTTLDPGTFGQHCQVQLPMWIEPGSLNPICKRFSLLLLFSSRKVLRPFLLLSWKLNCVGSCWRASSLYFGSCQASPISFSLDSNIKFPSPLFLFKLYVCVSFCHACSFSLQTSMRVLTNNHVTEPILGDLEISSIKETNPILFSLTSGRFLGQGKKAVSFFFLSSYHKSGL